MSVEEGGFGLRFEPVDSALVSLLACGCSLHPVKMPSAFVA